MRRVFIAASLLASGLPLQAAEPCVTLDNKAVAALFDDWNFALSSLDAGKVAQRYGSGAVLIPTLSNTPRTDPAAITEYFEHFLAKRPRGHIDSRTVQSGCNLAVDMGTYTFSLMDDKGTTSEVAARYTFIYQYRDGAWKILHHHSSAMPEVGANAGTGALAANESVEAAAAAAKEPPLANPLSRRSRRPRKDYLDPLPVKAAEKSAEKSMTRPAADLKPTADSKASADAHAAPAKVEPDKNAAEAKPASVAKTTPDTKPIAVAKPGELAKPPEAADARPSAEVRTAMFANLTTSPPPSKFYPPEAARRKEHGSVNLKVCADGTGTVSESMEVLKSSGSKLLDEAAMTWARAVTWVPATYNRQRVEGCAKVDVSFEPPPQLAHAGT
jgi:uncharacterized protein (TIGR02246 family)